MIAKRLPLRRLASISALSLLMLTSTGCELVADLRQAFDDFWNNPIQLRVNLESPSKEIDVTEQVNGAEDSLCNPTDSESCTLLKEIDKTDDGAVSTPPRVPDEFPAVIEVEDDQGNPVPDPQCVEDNPQDFMSCPQWTIAADDFLEQSNVYDAIDFAQAIPIDLSDEVQVTTPEAIKAVRIESIGVNWTDNELTFDTVPFDLYMTLDIIEDPDAEELLSTGAVTKVGTIDRQTALTDGVTPINFIDEEARALFQEGLLALKFTVVIAVPEGTVWTLADSPTTPGNKLKPQGRTDISMVATLSYTVTPRELAGRARDAYEAQRDEVQANGGFDL